jgi:two-component system sensor histidine kinase PhoQ
VSDATPGPGEPGAEATDDRPERPGTAAFLAALGVARNAKVGFAAGTVLAVLLLALVVQGAEAAQYPLFLYAALAVLNSQIDAGERPGPAELRETVQQMQARIRAELDRAARSGRRTMLAAIDPVPIAERVSRSLAKLYPETDFAVEGPAGLRANVAERDLYELLGNLLENAAKYGGGCVRSEIRALPTGGRRTGLLLTVEDDGPGMDPERFDAMLQRGVRGDEAVEGQGFGLAIVRRIVDSYHGAIRPTRSALGGLRLEVELRPA